MKNPLTITIVGVLMGLLMIMVALFIFQECSFIIGGCAVIVIGGFLLYYVLEKEE